VAKQCGFFGRSISDGERKFYVVDTSLPLQPRFRKSVMALTIRFRRQVLPPLFGRFIGIESDASFLGNRLQNVVAEVSDFLQQSRQVSVL
jgi:hypothetical protein